MLLETEKRILLFYENWNVIKFDCEKQITLLTF